jgi:serine/threonine-protein kinase RsbW
MRFEVKLSLPCDAVSVPLTRRTVAAALQQAGVDEDCLAEVKVVLSEACTNVLDHAVGSGSYEVTVTLDNDDLTIDVTDEGLGFLERSPSPVMPGPLVVRGRGGALISALTDRAHFDTTAATGGAAVHMSRRLSWADGGPRWRSGP